MALAQTLKYSGTIDANTTGGSHSGTTTSFSVDADALLVVAVCATQNVTSIGSAVFAVSKSAGTSTIGTITRSVEADQSVGSDTSALEIFTIPITGSGTLTLQIDDNTNTFGFGVMVWQVTGQHASSPIGATIGLADFSTDGSKTITLSGSPATTSLVFAAANLDTDQGSGKGVTVGTGWTESAEVGGTTDFVMMQGQYRANSTSTSVTWDDIKGAGAPTTFSFAGAAIEIKEATGTSTATVGWLRA